MRKQPCVLFARLFHETHSFVDDVTSMSDFLVRRGPAMLESLGDASPLGGALEFAAQHDWKVVPTADYGATPGGIVEDDVVESFWNDFTQSWQQEVDAVFLVLHGAMVSRSCVDVEGLVLQRIRSLPGAEAIPIFGVYDLHANFSSAMAVHADALVAFRENPHTDARQAAQRAAALLQRNLETGERPAMVLRQIPVIWPPIATGTSQDPMRSLERLARQIEASTSDIWAANINAGFAHADTPDTGVSFQAIARRESSQARDCLDQLEQCTLRMGELPDNASVPIGEAMASLRKPAVGLTVIIEAADNIGAGAPGDCTGCLRALVEHDVGNAAVVINDPGAVASLEGVTISDQLQIGIGGKGSRLDPGPVELNVELISLGIGLFELEDARSHLASMSGNFFDMGPCAVVRHRGIRILLTSNRTPPFDLGQWRSQGIEPTGLDVIVAKAAIAHKHAYDPITTRSILVDTPGPCSSDLRRFPYRHVARGLPLR